MPVVQSLMDRLVARYGADEGKRVYYAMEASGKGPFAKGAKHHAEHLAFAQRNGVPPIESRGKKKPPASSKKRGAGAKSTRAGRAPAARRRR